MTRLCLIVALGIYAFTMPAIAHVAPDIVFPDDITEAEPQHITDDTPRKLKTVTVHSQRVRQLKEKKHEFQ